MQDSERYISPLLSPPLPSTQSGAAAGSKPRAKVSPQALTRVETTNLQDRWLRPTMADPTFLGIYQPLTLKFQAGAWANAHYYYSNYWP